jgi:hypothetical protein
MAYVLDVDNKVIDRYTIRLKKQVQDNAHVFWRAGLNAGKKLEIFMICDFVENCIDHRGQLVLHKILKILS